MTAAQLARALPPYVTPVGLFVNAARADVDRVLALVPALVLQFHGDESPEACNAFGRPYLRAAAMQFADHSEVELERLQSERALEKKRQA